MKVLLTGGTGFVGRAMLPRLVSAGHEVRLLARRPDAPAALTLASSPAISIVTGDVLDAASLVQAARGIDAIIHLVGIISEVGPNTFENLHTRATHHALHAARENGASRFLQMSALGTRPEARSRYHQTKWAAEQAVRESGLDWTIFRPSLIYGRDDHVITMVTRLAPWSPFVPVVGRGRALLQPVAVEVVADAFCRALNEPRSQERTFDLCGPERLTFPQILDTILAVCGRRRLKLYLPLWLARAQATVFEAVFPSLLGLAPPLNRDQILMLEEDNVGDPEPADTAFHLVHEPFRRGLERSFRRGPTKPLR
jgi:NADH dehydrogenase